MTETAEVSDRVPSPYHTNGSWTWPLGTVPAFALAGVPRPYLTNRIVASPASQQ